MNSNRALILTYHRVTEAHSDPWALNVSPQHFEEQLKILQTHARPVSLRELPYILSGGRTPPRPVVLTFDDGYADNLHPATDLLRAAAIPATIFLVARDRGAAPEFWWDELDRMFLYPGALPSTLHLSIGGASFRWDLGSSASYSKEESRQYWNWRAWEEPPTPRHALYYELWLTLRPLLENERSQTMAELRAWANGGASITPVYPLLSIDQFTELAQPGVIEIGAHTVSHPMLSSLPEDLQRAEITQSKSRLEQILDQPVTSFAYPYGEYTGVTAAITKNAGFLFACSTRSGLVEPDANPYRLPRVAVEDWDGDTFLRHLLEWFNG